MARLDHYAIGDYASSAPAACPATHRRPRDPTDLWATGGPRELRADACLRATGCLTLLGRGVVGGPKAELNIGADKGSSA